MNAPLSLPSNILPTFENRLVAWLLANGVDITVDEYMVAYLRYVHRLAKQGLDADEMAARLAEVQDAPQLVLEDQWREVEIRS